MVLPQIQVPAICLYIVLSKASCCFCRSFVAEFMFSMKVRCSVVQQKLLCYQNWCGLILQSSWGTLSVEENLYKNKECCMYFYIIVENRKKILSFILIPSHTTTITV